MTNSSIHPTEFSRFIALCLIFAIAFSALHWWMPAFVWLPDGTIPSVYQTWEIILLKLAAAWLFITFIASGLQYRSSYLSVINGAMLGLGFFILVLGLRIVDPTHIGWLVKEDWQWHFLGWHFFRQEPWHMPPGSITNFMHPMGTSIAYTDSIPLVALLLKPFHALLPADFQYLGGWMLLCFVLQGVFGVLLMRLWTPNLVLQNLGALFFILVPILLHRHGHIALMSQWLLLAGLWLYFKPWPETRWFAPLWWWLVLIGLSAAIHPYLMLMLIGLAVAFYWKFWLVDCGSKIVALGAGIVQLLCLALTAIIVAWVAGYFLVTESGSLVGDGLGYYSMNLLAPFNPIGGWSIWLKDIPLATAGQYEGFGYFGLGVLLLAALSVYLMLQQWPKREWWAIVLPVLLVALIFTLFALSPQITWASRTLLTYEHEWLAVLGTFHASGRFFWLLYYLLLFMLLGVIIQRHGAWLAAIVLGIALSIQLIEFQPQHRGYQHNLQVNDAWHTWTPAIDFSEWETWTQDVKHLVKIPSRFCGEAATPFFPFAYYAATHGLTINTAYVARYNTQSMEQYCDDMHRNMLDKGVLQPDTAYIISPAFEERFKANAQQSLNCQRISEIETCKVVVGD